MLETELHERMQALVDRVQREADASGYFLNPDREFTTMLLEGYLINEQRYGYPACPCRLAAGDRDRDRDLICPCDYRDADLDEYGMCYCALYVSETIARGEGEAAPIPDRRPPGGPDAEHTLEPVTLAGLPFPIWRCNVCGYLCARTHPPAKCPICHVTIDRFSRFV
jgi:ferredoxin-thioredoxin reductase catalytic subunit